jgi:RHS repeat-associated protein
VYAFGVQDDVYDGSGASYSDKYYYSLAGHLIGELNGGKTKFLLTDLLGSVVASISNTANSAAVLGNQVYGPYGNGSYSKGTITTPKGYTGQYNDALTTLDYYNARYYDPAVGVFLSADTASGNMAGMNPYAYVDGNPETHSDPTGRMMITAGSGGGGLTVTPPSPPPSSCSGFWCWAQGAAHTVWNGITQGASTVAQGAVKVADFVTGVSSMVSDVRTLFDSKASFWDKVGAGVNLVTTAASDVLMVTGIGEAARGAELLLKGGVDLGEHLLEGEGTTTLEHVAEDLGCGLSFAPATLVATAKGEQAIGTLQVGEKVWAYNPKTRKMEQEPILHVWINHDTDLVDLTLTSATPSKQHGKAATKTSETIHTNKKHPFLTKEKGFLQVGQIKLGMHVLRADGTYGVVTGWKVVPGAEMMYDLEVAQDHTFTVGIQQWVVHNCSLSLPQQAQARAVEIRDAMVKNAGWWFRREATVGVAYIEGSEGGVQRFVAINEGALGKWGSDVRNLLEPGEQWIEGDASGKIHPEVLLKNFAADTGQKIIGIGASTGFCDACKAMLLQEVGQEFMGQP